MYGEPVTPRRKRPLARRMSEAGVTMAAVLAALWALQMFSMASAGQLALHWGIMPRQLDELDDIFTAPLVHAGFAHLAANSVPLAVLGFLAALRGLGRFLAATVIAIVASGLGVWLLAQPHSVTLGASGLVFGYFGYVVARGFFDRNAADITIGIMVVIVYGGMLVSVLPVVSPAVSWLGHLFGLVGGFLAAMLLRRHRPD